MADKVIISKSKLVALGDVIREKTGSSEKMTVDVMTETMRNHSGDGSTGGGIPDYVMNHPFNNSNNTDVYYGKNLVGVKKIRIDLPKLAEAYAVLEGYTSAEELFNMVPEWNGYNSKSFNHIFSMLYTSFSLCSTDTNGVYTELLYSHVQYGFKTSTYPKEDYLAAVYLNNDIVAGIKWPDGGNTLTEYEILQQLGTVEYDISEYTTGIAEGSGPDSGEWYQVLIPTLINFGYRTDSNYNRLFFNLNEVTPDWIEFVY